MTFRSILFWLHLAAGAIAGLVIAMMCLTGVAIAFEKEMIEWAERDLTRVAPPSSDAPRLGLDALQAKIREKFPEAPAQMNVTVSSDPRHVVVFNAGRAGSYYANPYTGEVRPQGAKDLRAFLRTMEDWHRWLALDGDKRDFGKAVTGAGNAVFLFLAVSGLYLWWPRRGSPAARWLVPRLRGQARDWNWHNVIGFWSAPILILLTFSGMVISYRWTTNLVYSATGSPPPAPLAPPAVPTPAAGATPLGLDALLAAARGQAKEWETITLRFGGALQRGTSGGAPAPAADKRPIPVAAAVRQAGNWPLFFTPTWHLDPFTGAVLRHDQFGDRSPGWRTRVWLRFLHTGEALGWPGQLVAGFATLGGLALVWTGFAMAIRRLRSRGRQADAAEPRAVARTEAA